MREVFPSKKISDFALLSYGWRTSVRMTILINFNELAEDTRL